MVLRISYWLATFVIFALMLLSIITYHTNHDVMAGYFTQMGYPAYLVYPLAYAKLVALIVILTNRYRNLKDIAYGAYFINLIMATTGHLLLGDNPVHAYVGLVALPVSYILSNHVRGEPVRDAFLFRSRN